MFDFWAHSPKPDEDIPPHLLREHLRTVAELAVANARDFAIPGIEALLNLIGYTHDIGKYKLTFQHERLGYDPSTGQEIHSSQGRVDHSSLGAVINYPRQKPVGHPVTNAQLAVARVIAAHHAGLVDTAAFEQRVMKQRNDPERLSALEHALTELPELREIGQTLGEIAIDLPPSSQEFLTRMLLSCLVDADHTDTEAHCSPVRSAVRRKPFTALQELWQRLEHNQALFDSESDINQLRQEMYDEALDAASLTPGFFRLTMPTGAGKTRTSLAFALQHALQHDLRRVIYAIPYTSIIEQTARVFQEILNKDSEQNVLEHHSAIDPDTLGDEQTQLWAKLLTESWAAPVTVTTTVQLFESLFANRTSKVKKLHNIAGAVIILDEVQALPTPLLRPILDALNELVTHYRATVVLCTATQPALDIESGFSFPELNNVRDIIADPAPFFKALNRVDYNVDIEQLTPWETVAGRMMEAGQALCIVNLRRHAQELFQLVSQYDPTAIHLSTDLFPAHRQELLAVIAQRLERGEPCRVVSTTLIECGVDVDFPFVLRALGPLDSLVQAAGRCNREGKLRGADGSLCKGEVWIFEPEDQAGLRGDHEVKTHGARQALRSDADLASPDAFRTYFRKVYQSTATDARKIMSLREDFAFKQVAKEFKFIDADTVPAVITRMEGEGGATALDHPASLLEQLESGEGGKQQDLWRELQRYSVNIYRSQLGQLARYLRQIRLRNGIELDLYEWTGVYDQQLGVVQEDDHDRYVA